MFVKLLAAYDGSDHSIAALKIAADMANKYKAKLHVIHVPQAIGETVLVGYSAVPVPPTPEELEDAANKARAAIEEVLAAAKAKPEEIVTKTGEPGRVIVDYANAQGVDLIVMGRRGLGQLGGLLIGSTTNRVNQLAECAVLTVK